MRLILKGANFSASNIGTLNTWLVNVSPRNGLIHSIPSSVGKNSSFEYTITIAEGYTLENNNVVVTMGGTPVTSGVTVDGNTINIAIASVTGNVTINVPVKSISGGEEEEPETPTNYTFTINPDPDTATVTLSATGYSTVSGTGNQSIIVANGTTVNWSVSADGYTTRTGNWTISGGNKTENIVLVTSATPVNLWKYSSSDMDAIMTDARYRLTSGLPYKEEGDNYDLTYGTTEKIYVNGNNGTYTLGLESGKTYRWQFIPYFEFGFLKLHNPWGGSVQTSMHGKRIFFYRADDTLIENDTKCLDATGMLVTVPAGAVYMRFMCWGYGAQKSKVQPCYDTLMITEGETEYSEYVPYQG